jgi:very-short-patch-repair endonuclease
MRDALPGLVGLAGGKSVQSVREAVIGFTDKLDAELPWLEMNCPGGAIVIDGSTPEGTRALRNYLEYARTGQLTVPEDTGAAPDSDFEVAVMDVLRMRGYEVTPQLGVAGYRIDIAVKHPDAPGTYLAAIECDGASYHSAASVRDRDRIRQDILESVGWRGRIWRIWSTDWFRTPRQETEKLLSFLDDLRKSWKPEHSSGASWVEEGTAPIPRPADVPANEADRRVVSQVLLETDEEIEVAVGDIVRYAEVSQPTDVLTVRIVRSASDLANGLISVSAPLAQTLLGGVVGDEVVLHVPGSPARVFRILEIKRSE